MIYNNDFKEDKEIIKTKKNVSKKYIRKINKSLVIKGCYNIIKDLFNGCLTLNKLKNISDNFVKYSYILQGSNKERKAKTPFLKWYVKGHSNRSLLCKIIEAKLTNNTLKLNDNHMVHPKFTKWDNKKSIYVKHIFYSCLYIHFLVYILKKLKSFTLPNP